MIMRWCVLGDCWTQPNVVPSHTVSLTKMLHVYSRQMGTARAGADEWLSVCCKDTINVQKMSDPGVPEARPVEEA